MTSTLKKKKHFNAFTLAETLIVMGIIGVVAALTIPNLTQSTGDKEKVAKVKKLYANMNDAFGRATAVYGPLDNWFINDSTTGTARTKRFAERILDFMKVTKTCGFTADTACFTDKDSTIDSPTTGKNKQWTYNDANTYKAILADGTSISFDNTSSQIYIDIDGQNKGKSMWGSDLFVFRIVNGELNCGNLWADGESPCGTTDNDDCACWVIMNDNVDYLKTTDGTSCPGSTIKLKWGGSTTCK